MDHSNGVTVCVRMINKNIYKDGLVGHFKYRTFRAFCNIPEYMEFPSVDMVLVCPKFITAEDAV